MRPGWPGEYAGITPPASPGPVDAPAGADLGRHAGRYERTSRRFDVSVRDGRLYVVVTPTGQLAAAADAEPEELELYPADPAGNASSAGPSMTSPGRRSASAG